MSRSYKKSPFKKDIKSNKEWQRRCNKRHRRDTREAISNIVDMDMVDIPTVHKDFDECADIPGIGFNKYIPNDEKSLRK
jgi:hypothetical protein